MRNNIAARHLVQIPTRHKSEETANGLDAITLENMKAGVLKELHDPIADINDNVCKRIVDIIIAPNNDWKKERQLSHCVTEYVK